MKQVSIFDKIDNYYEKQPNTNAFYMTILLVAVLIGYLIYDYTYESTQENLEESRVKLQEVTNRLNEVDGFIETHRINDTIKKLTLKLQDTEKNRDSVIDDNNYFDNKLREASKLLYNQKNWSEFMAKINDLSKTYKVNLYDVKSSINDLNTQNVEEVFNVVFNLDGKFQDILHFVNKLEQSVDVVDVSYLSIYKDGENKDENNSYNNNSSNQKQETNPINKNSIKADIKISIWGIKY
ncbi:hypothetical protein [Campylobacter sp. MG1]|uniref:hypothetical protein n=1 Tax=Campylobacter sp. MG1 TaxID=2976332 RepID=UPI00226C9C34|nr:hypothetical protein [Campylobacter sp. MG1]